MPTRDTHSHTHAHAPVTRRTGTVLLRGRGAGRARTHALTHSRTHKSMQRNMLLRVCVLALIACAALAWPAASRPAAVAVPAAAGRAPNATQLAELRHAIDGDFGYLSREERDELARILVEQGHLDVPEEPDLLRLSNVMACPRLPARPPPSSIKDLRPVDVRAVAAIGDSIACGTNALSTNWFNLKRYRGLAYCIGGDAGRVTLPNILGQISGRPVIGPSTGIGEGERNCNAADGGAVTADVPAQVDRMIAALKSRMGTAYETNWKVVTLYIGSNNLCEVCKDARRRVENGKEQYERHLRASFDRLTAMPRTFVSVVSDIDCTLLAPFKGPFCGAALAFVCDCCSTTDARKHAIVREVRLEYRQVLYQLQTEYAARMKAERRDDFAIVVQPFLEDMHIPDKSFLSKADCFHPSGIGQAWFAVGLFNSMTQPVGQKMKRVPNDMVNCPTEGTLLYTP